MFSEIFVKAFWLRDIGVVWELIGVRKDIGVRTFPQLLHFNLSCVLPYLITCRRVKKSKELKAANIAKSTKSQTKLKDVANVIFSTDKH